MEVKLDKEYTVAAGRDAAWQVLADIRELATCMPGAQITGQADDTHYKGSVRVKVGPAVAAFAGDIEVLEIDPAGHRLRILGKGADKGGSSASMTLAAEVVPDGERSKLLGHADVIVNGKFAQFGGRMMGSVADMVLAQFADTFSKKAAAVEAAAAAGAGAAAGAAPANAAATAPGPAGNGTAPAGGAGAEAADAVAADAAAGNAAPPSAAPLPSAPKELNGLALLWALLRNFVAGLFGGKA
ncbi:hypothetical protein GCM10023144_26740 [Pigmentiphaga soli]|uniref:Carbon monoxide dehydrogenase n=1 Tax=Pigmentiphaga soli TaxID=1007095 RepID=A0ABP8H507_9BURK